MPEFRFDRETFLRRLKLIYDNYTGNHALSEVDAICVLVGGENDITYAKSTAVQTWLLDNEMLDTIIVFCEKDVLFLASSKKINFLRQVENGKENIPYSLNFRFIERKKQEGDTSCFKELCEAMKQSKEGKSVGVFLKEKHVGPFAAGWNSTVDKYGFKKVDVSHSIALVMAVKDEGEIARIKKACELTTRLYSKYLKVQIVNIVDAEKKVRHSKLADGLEAALNDNKYLSPADIAVSELCYPPIIQSGGKYSLKYSVTSDNNYIHYGAIICMFGTRYKSYCSNIVRTFLIFPSNEVLESYNRLLELEEELLTHLKDGVKLCDVYNAVLRKASEKTPDLSKNLTPQFGNLSGIEFKESSIGISGRCTVAAKKGMVFQVSIGLSNLVNEAVKDEGRNYALFIGDTVLVNEDSPASILNSSNKKAKHISILLKEVEEEDENGIEGHDDESDVNEQDLSSRVRRSAVLLKTKTRQEMTSEEKRQAHQKELGIKLNEEAKKRLMSLGGQKSPEKIRKSNVSYKSASLFPKEPDIADSKIFVDKKYETVILPIYGNPCPFHISTIKNVSLTVEGDYTYLRINFFHPGSTVVKNEQFPNPDSVFVKELTYRASNLKQTTSSFVPASNLNTAFRLIKDVQKQFKEVEAEKREMEGVVKQDALIITPNRNNPRLKDLSIRPNIIQKRLTGNLEAHSNGLRYTTIRGDKVDILYSNVKHAFYQPCDGEMIILLHFHLKHPIIFGKKKQTDIQFYTEVGELATDLNKHRSHLDKDDIAAEQAERDYRQKLKTVFRTFVERAEGAAKGSIEFETPFRDLGFYGTPFRSMVKLYPTSSCLVNLMEWPPFVVTLDEVELVHFERVQFTLKNFDMVFIFKDYHRKVMMVNSIAMTQLDNVKDWLNSCDIKYTEGIQSLNWIKIMKTIVDDVEGFFENGGWNFLELDSEDNENGSARSESEANDESYNPSDVDSGEESSESEYSEDEEDEESSEEEGESGDESGKSWSELEEEARRADMEKREESEDEKKKSKKRVSHSRAENVSKKKRV